MVSQYSGGAASLHYSMYLLAFKELMGMPGMMAHQVLLHQGRLTEWSDELAGRVIFITHEWLGHAHPDPAGEQLSILKRVLRRLSLGLATLQSEWKHQYIAAANERIDSVSLARAVPGWHFWIDYTGVPQHLSDGDLQFFASAAEGVAARDMVASSQAAAIRSIPAYVERCVMVFVLAPSCQHEGTGEICDYSTWRSRGWCRVEFLCAVLSKAQVPLLKCNSAAGPLEFMSTWDIFSLPPGEGVFSCCTAGHTATHGTPELCDKIALRRVVEDMLTAAVAGLHARGDRVHHRILVCDRERMLRGFPPPKQAAVGAPRAVDPVQKLRDQLRWEPPDDAAAAAGRAPSLVHWAARAGDAAALAGLLALHPGDLDRPMPIAVPRHFLPTGLRPLHLAAWSADGRMDATQILLEAKAACTAFDAGYGYDALMWAAGAGTLDQLRGWLDRFPEWDLNRTSVSHGCAALVSAAFSGEGSAARVRLLLERGARARAGSGIHAAADAALLTACGKDDSDPEVVRVLLEAGCSPTVAMRPAWRRWRMVFAGTRLAARLAEACGRKPGPLLRRLSEVDGASAVATAALSGHVAVTQLLLSVGADPSARNLMGRTALESARVTFGGRAPDPIEVLLGGQPSMPRPPSQLDEATVQHALQCWFPGKLAGAPLEAEQGIVFSMANTSDEGASCN